LDDENAKSVKVICGRGSRAIVGLLREGAVLEKVVVPLSLVPSSLALVEEAREIGVWREVRKTVFVKDFKRLKDSGKILP
jgi:hypothetical protein